MNGFDKILRQLRKEQHLSQSELADILELSRSSVSMYERGEREPDSETLGKIASYFHIDMNTLLGHTSEESKAAPPPNTVSFDDMNLLLARNGRKLTAEQKQELIRTLLSDD